MSHSKRMAVGNHIAGVESAKGLSVVPGLLPLGFDQMKWILSATACHRARDDCANASGKQSQNTLRTGLSPQLIRILNGMAWKRRRLRNLCRTLNAKCCSGRGIALGVVLVNFEKLDEFYSNSSRYENEVDLSGAGDVVNVFCWM